MPVPEYGGDRPLERARKRLHRQEFPKVVKEIKPIDVMPREQERIKAFELFLAAEGSGKRRSYRSISQELGVHEATVRRWAKIDLWAEKVHTALRQSAKATLKRVTSLKEAVRKGLGDGLYELNVLITANSSKPRDRIEAVRALADIAVKLGVVIENTEDGVAGTGTQNLDFRDDVTEDGLWQPATSPQSPESTKASAPDGTALPRLPGDSESSPEDEESHRLKSSSEVERDGEAETTTTVDSTP